MKFKTKKNKKSYEIKSWFVKKASLTRIDKYLERLAKKNKTKDTVTSIQHETLHISYG